MRRGRGRPRRRPVEPDGASRRRCSTGTGSRRSSTPSRSCARASPAGRSASSGRRGRSCRRSTRSSSTMPSRTAGRSRRCTPASRRSTGRAEVAFACGVDTPLLVPAFVRAVLRVAPQRRRCRRARDRRPGAAAARRLPRAIARGSGRCSRRPPRPEGHPATCAGARARGAGAARGSRARRGRPAAALGRNANTPEEWAALARRSTPG